MFGIGLDSVHCLGTLMRRDIMIKLTQVQAQWNLKSEAGATKFTLPKTARQVARGPVPVYNLAYY